jgi:hypothetical protein
MKTINVNGIKISYDLNALADEVNNIKYNCENYVNHHRTSGDGVSLHEGAPTEDEFIKLRTLFASKILNLENELVTLIEENLFLTKSGVLAKNRRRPILVGDDDFYVNIIDEYDHDFQFDRPYLKLERVDDKEGRLIIHEMQTNY